MAPTKNGKKTGEAINIVEEIRRQKRAKKWRRRRGVACVILCIIAYLSGAIAALFSYSSNLYESASIALATQAGFPVQTGISALYQVEELSGGFVALGAESCVVYSAGGNRLRSIQSGYLRPTIAVGGNRYLLYNRAGKELRVESRTQTLYTKTYENNILLASMSENGSVAVATESDRYLASLTMYTANMEEVLTYSMTDREGIPIRMEYSPDNKTLAIATINASDGQLTSQIYCINISAGTVDCIASETATPMAIEWVSKTELLVFYDSQVTRYDIETQTVTASYSYQSPSFADYAVYEDMVVLLFTQGTESEFVLLDETFTILSQQEISRANGVVLSETDILLLYEQSVATYSQEGAYIDTYETAQNILALVQAKNLLLFTANETSIFVSSTDT